MTSYRHIPNQHNFFFCKDTTKLTLSVQNPSKILDGTITHITDRYHSNRRINYNYNT